MPVTRSELMYLAAGIAIGGAVGANWDRIRPLVAGLMGPAAEGLQDAYDEVLAQFAAQAEAASDRRATSAAPPPSSAPNPRSAPRRAARSRSTVEPNLAAGPAT